MDSRMLGLDMEEVLIVTSWLKVTKAMIKELKKNNHSRGEEIARLERIIFDQDS